ncbi:MAG: hypothetical protein IJE45_00725 [Bacilli bacterium]|nr:hypothetical protein [Bacilli bacterium]
MYNIFKLTQVYFKNFIGSLIKNNKNPKFYIGILICVFLSLFITLTFTFNSISSTMIFVEYANKGVVNAEHMAMYVNCTMAILMLLFVTIMRSVMPSKSSDNDSLLSMPITKMEITIAKSLYNYVIDFVLFVSILLPSFIVYVVMVKNASWLIVVRGMILVLMLPLLSNGLATFIGILTQKIATKMKNYSIVQTIIIIILTGGYLVANFSIQGYLTNLVGTVDEIKNKIWLLKVLLEFILEGKIIGYSLIGLLIISVYVLGLIVTKKQLGKLDIKDAHKKSKIYYKLNSPFKSMVKKEIKQYFNTPTLVINTILGGVIYFGMCVGFCILGPNKIMSFMQTVPLEIEISIDAVLIMILTLIISLFNITGTSISLEGKTFWIIKTTPLSHLTICFSKVAANLVLTGITCLISYPFVLSFIDLQYFWGFLLIPFVSTIVSSTMGIIINLNFPKMEWDKEEVVVKTSLSALLSFFLPILFIALPYLIYIVEISKYCNLHVFMLVNLMYLIVLIMIMVLWINTKGKKMLDKVMNS